MMTFHQPAMNVMRARVSWRKFEPRPLEDEHKVKVLDTINSLTTGLLGEKVKFNLIERRDDNIRDARIGGYGLITNPHSFIIGTIQSSARAYESYGYLLEHLVLKVTDLGLNSVWIGSFNPEYFTEIKLAQGEIVPSICVIGYGSKRRSLIDRTARLVISAHKRKSWEDLFFHGDFNHPLTDVLAGSYADGLEMVRIAPSSGNTQPWRVIKDTDSDTFHFYMKTINKEYGRKHLHEVDLGISMCHFELTCREKGLVGTWQVSDPCIPTPAAVEYRFTWSPE